MGMAVLNWGMCYPHQRKIPKCLTAAVGGFEFGTTVVWETSVNNPFTKDSAPGSVCYKTRLIRGNQKPQTFSKRAAAKCIKKKIKYCQSAWVTNVPDLFVLLPVPFYEHIKATNNDFIRKVVLLTSSKHGQKF